jgi:hypothetical protein
MRSPDTQVIRWANGASYVRVSAFRGTPLECAWACVVEGDDIYSALAFATWKLLRFIEEKGLVVN